MKKYLISLTLVFLTLISSALSDIKVGIVLGFTGPTQELTPPMAKSIELAFKEASKSGLLLNGKAISSTKADTTCTDFSAATEAAKNILSLNVVALIGGICPGISNIIADKVSVPNNIMIISPAATNSNFKDINYNNLFFKTTPSISRSGQILADITKQKKIKNVAITYSNDDNGKKFKEIFKKALEANDIKVTISISHDDGKKDYSSEVAALASAGGDAVAIIGYPEQGGKGIIQASLDSGAFDRFILSEEMINQSLLDTFGEDLDKSFGIVSGYTDKSGLVFEKMLNEIGIDSASPFTGESYDSAALIVLAIQAGKSFERETIARNIMNIANSPGKKIYPGELKKGLDLLARGKKINYEGVTELEFFKNGEPYGSFFEKKIKNGKFITKKLR